VGQDEAKKALAIAVAQHCRRIENPQLKAKSNILIAGPTGSGKTELIRVVSKLLGVPMVQIDATTLTPRGYVGESVDVCVERLLSAAGLVAGLAERGIVFLDEFDKLGCSDEQGSFRSKAVQQELLRLVEGDAIEIRHPSREEPYVVNTDHILFIAAGAFVGLFERKEERAISFSAEHKAAGQEGLSASRLASFGLIPELVGRFPVGVLTRGLSRQELVAILTEPEESLIRYYVESARAEGVELRVTDGFLAAVAEKAIKDGLGARGLKKHLEAAFSDFLYRIDEYRGQAVEFNEGGLVAPEPKSLRLAVP
jgi:ATP-dependent Clp protease ATP-binding subunit ClpX